jgi:Fe2+ or Zn2+ uptake regulation protein
MAGHHDPATLLRSAGKRVTNARLAVATILQHGGGHMTASEVAAAVGGSGARVDQSTVYRVLADLRDSGLVAESRFGSGEASYEWIAGSDHHHLHCTECGTTLPLDDDVVESFVEAVRKRHGFSAEARHTVMTGICGKCQDKGTVER